MKFVTRTLCYAFIIASIVCAEDVPEKSKVQQEISSDTKVQSKRGADDSRQINTNLNSGVGPSQATITNLPQFYGGHFAQLGNFFASAAAPQIYYVKAPQSNHAGVQYPTANSLKIAYVPAPQPQHSVTYATAPTNSKVAVASQPHYQNYQLNQLAYSHQPISYSAAAIAVPYNNNHQQQIIQIPNGYQLAAYSHQPVQISQPYSYVTSAPAHEAAKAIVHGPSAAQTSNAYHSQPQTFTFPTYQHVAAPVNIPTTAKFVAFQSYSPSQYKPVNAPAQPSATVATHGAHDGATSFASFSQQLNQRHHHATPTAITPVKVLAQPHQQYYVTAPPPSSGYNTQKIAFQPIAAASSSPQAYESPHNVNGVIHYGTHLYHPAIGKYGIGQVASPPPSPKFIYSH